MKGQVVASITSQNRGLKLQLSVSSCKLQAHLASKRLQESGLKRKTERAGCTRVFSVLWFCLSDHLWLFETHVTHREAMADPWHACLVKRSQESRWTAQSGPACRSLYHELHLHQVLIWSAVTPQAPEPHSNLLSIL